MPKLVLRLTSEPFTTSKPNIPTLDISATSHGEAMATAHLAAAALYADSPDLYFAVRQLGEASARVTCECSAGELPVALQAMRRIGARFNQTTFGGKEARTA